MLRPDVLSDIETGPLVVVGLVIQSMLLAYPWTIVECEQDNMYIISANSARV